MRKHDEGYALVFVLVVVVVLSVIAIALMTGALKNLQAQSSSIERMEDKYVAEGMIEVVVTTLNVELSKYNPGFTVLSSESIAECRSEIASAVDDYLQRAKNKIPDLNENQPTLINKTLEFSVEWETLDEDDLENNQDLYVAIDASYGSVQIRCRLLLNDIIQYADAKWDYSKPVISYKEYQISYVGGDS